MMNFQRLITVSGFIKEKINYARRYYHGTVREYNQSLAVFPENMVGNSFGLNPVVFFAEDAEAVPKVSCQ